MGLGLLEEREVGLGILDQARLDSFMGYKIILRKPYELYEDGSRRV